MPPTRTSRVRASQTARTPARDRDRPVNTTMPDYEPLEAPLTAKGIEQLSALHIRHDLSSVHSRLETAHESLASAAADMNEMKASRVTTTKRTAARRAERGEEPDTEGIAAVEELVDKVDSMTGKVEAAVRRIVDRQARREAQEKALQELSGNRGLGAGIATQSEAGPTQDDSEQREESRLHVLRGKIEAEKARYEALSMRERYSAHNAYVNFRRMLHLAQYPDDDEAAPPPVPHATAWFDEASGQPRNLGAGRGDAQTGEENEEPVQSQAPGNGGEDEDSDIEAVGERTTINCPLTLLPMQEPMTSRKCPHAFERSAIMEYLGGPPGSQAARRVKSRSAPCPVCEVVLTIDDLTLDPILQRKVRRIQAAEKRMAAGAGDDDDDDDADDDRPTRKRPAAEEIPSSSPAPGSARDRLRVKSERLSGLQAGRAREEAMDVDDDD